MQATQLKWTSRWEEKGKEIEVRVYEGHTFSVFANGEQIAWNNPRKFLSVRQLKMWVRKHLTNYF